MTVFFVCAGLLGLLAAALTNVGRLGQEGSSWATAAIPG
jgi:hypothetical protein